MKYLQKRIPWVLLGSILLVAFWIRTLGVEYLPVEQFTENDAYLYNWQAKIILEHGRLPARDMHRWVPLGRDNTQLFSLYAYIIAYVHKSVVWIHPNLTLYHIQLYLPAVCFTIGLAVIFLFLTRAYGLLFASIAGVLLATLPGSIERSSAGFGDRDAWCWMLGTLAVTSYLWKEQMPAGWRRCVVTALAGFTVFLGGLSWEGFGFFLLMIIAVELWKFCTTDKEDHLQEYLLWMLMFVPWLFLIHPTYRHGAGFSKHVAALMLFPPLMVFILRGGRYLLLHFYKPLESHAQKLAWFFTLLAIIVGLGYFFSQASTFEDTVFAFRENSLMKTIDELKDPRFRYWSMRYGAIFSVGSFGLIVTSLYLWKWKAMPVAISTALFSGTTFFRDYVSGWTSSSTCDTLFLVSLVLTLLSLGTLVYLQRERINNDIVTIAILTWFFLWVALSRGGKRYDFFIGVPLAFFTAALIHFGTNSDSVSRNILHSLLKTILGSAILAGFMFLVPLGAYTENLLLMASSMRGPIPGNNQMITAFRWMKAELRQPAVVAAHWRYGSQLNVFAGVKTIMDQDQHIPHWIYLYNQHVHGATTAREALEFLKTHDATHLMLTQSHAPEVFLEGELSDAFVPAYPTENFRESNVKIWAIHYPPDIAANPKYLATEPEKSSEE